MHIRSLQIRIRRRTRGINGNYTVLESVGDKINVMRRQVHKYVPTRHEEFFGRTRVIGEEDVGHKRVTNLPALQSSFGCDVGWIESSLEATTELDAGLVGVLKRFLDFIRRLIHGLLSKDRNFCIGRLSNVLAVRKCGCR